MSSDPRLETIVVATDFSDNADQALRWAAHLARQQRARLVVAHASLPASPPAPEFVVLPVEYFEELHEHDRKRLEAVAAKLREGDLEVESELIVGAAAPGILEIASRRRADLLVVGTHGRTGLKRLLLGSTAAQVVRKSPCPVVTVHPGNAGKPRPIRTLLLPTDFSADATRAAEAATRALAADGRRRIVLVHAFSLPVESTHLPARVLLDAIRVANQGANARIQELASRLRRPGAEVDTIVREGVPADVVLEVAKAIGPDLIAMGTHGCSGLKRLFLGSTTESVLPSAPCPVLTVRRFDET